MDVDGKFKTPDAVDHEKRSGTSSSDLERNDDVKAGTTQLQRRLQSRHLQMIAIGGTIGTGLFIGSGGALAKAGPAGALIAYAFVGTLVYSVMVALGEMATYIPISGAFTVYAARFVDPSLGFAMGWIYFFSWAITYALELTASGLIIQYWAPNLNIGIFISVFWVLISALNFLPVSFYGEVEFWFASIKVVTVIGFLIFGICINAGAGQQGYIGFKYWNHPGAFAEYLVEGNPALAKFVGFWAVMIQAGFSYQGTELVGIAAGETANPRKTVPAAIKKTFYRILFFFVGTVLFLGILIPYDNEQLLSDNTDASASPFVIAAKLAGVNALPGIINAVLLTVILSAANACVFSGSRILVGLADERCAPAIFKRTTSTGVPWVAVAFTAAFGLLGYMNLSNGGSTVFEWLLNITAVCFVSPFHSLMPHTDMRHYPGGRLHQLDLHQHLPHRLHASAQGSGTVARHITVQGVLAALVLVVWSLLQLAHHHHQRLHCVHAVGHEQLLHRIRQLDPLRRHVRGPQDHLPNQIYQARRGRFGYRQAGG
jgi:amino acid transporter